MKTRTKIILLMLLVIITGSTVVLTQVLKYGLSARDKPTAVEEFVARRFRHFAIPSTAREMTNPIPLTPEIIIMGRAHFADHCASCHGNDGSGKTEIGQNLYPKAPDMKVSPTQSLSDGEIFYIIKNGIRLTGMPAWGDNTTESDEQTWHLVHFIRHLPKITEEEIVEMKTMNPRSPEEIKEEEEDARFLEGTGKAQSSNRRHH